MHSETGYDEVRRLFDYLCSINQIGPHVTGRGIDETRTIANGTTSRGSNQIEICVIDADDLLDNPSGIVKAYCGSVGIGYHPDLLKWDSEDAHEHAKEVFQKWKGFHEDAIHSTELKARLHVSFHSLLSLFDSLATTRASYISDLPVSMREKKS